MTEESGLEPEAVELAGRLFDMARTGDAASLASYIDAGIPVDLTNSSGDTLVMLAAYHGHVDAVVALIERGADVNRANDKNQTPLAGAVFKGEDAVVKALVSGGADPRGGHPSAIDAARMFGREDYLSLLES
ncbi:ankyrin repeat domain-containing protein [Rhodococcus sp. ACPA4]|jgi:ankyrin repeat protein|uniref:Ankyrin repeat domain-containing protein n=1 Tax=Rhodococcus globerulus TaxID=33008 RepID=A0ABU4BU70_RHOGO|nr:MULTISPECIES: ankyrin repeat domain-containing protein [Rhodococcus]MCE4266275.1 ankyrin repeat domain-containing protein [Rhodococcus globerulus]MDV6267739.1 ankyrin repeat domain-containing protein [Rhodococcus globerulus]MDV8065732.1 ankyrin repeat domain-containing protein [Rhodococcus sp. IEGM 1366]NRI67993.1 ankyrin repeat domain-containing protein [Rhodococcus sp. MS16]PBC43862.1 ankyrin repeat domain-containing protein [Rhodococcus sp. ACPA4]